MPVKCTGSLKSDFRWFFIYCFKQLLSTLTGRQSFPSCQFWECVHSFSFLAPLPSMKMQTLKHKTGISFKDSYQLIFWFVHYKHPKLRMQFCQFKRKEQYNSFLSQSYFYSAGLARKKASKNYFSLSSQISQDAPKHLNCSVRRYLFMQAFQSRITL